MSFLGAQNSIALGVQGLIHIDTGTGTIAVVTDPYWSSVSMLLHGDGVNGGQNNTFLDGSSYGATVSRFGNTTQGSFNPFVSTYPYAVATNGGSAYFDGTVNYLTVPNDAAFALGSNDFTIECWLYSTVAGSTQYFAGKSSVAGTANSIIFYKDTANTLSLYVKTAGGADITATSVATIPLNTWTHVAGVRNGATLRLYINGVQDGTNGTLSTSALATTTEVFAVGATGSFATGRWNGYISSFRLVNGTCLYPSGTTFTPSTVPLTAVTNTSLLLNMSNAAIFDNAEINNLETVGTAQISTSVFKYGTGSMAFNGTTDYLPALAKTALAFGAGNFTIECWIYSTAAGVDQYIIGQSNVTGLSNSIIFYKTAANTVGFYAYAPGAFTVTSTATISASTWTHVAIVRDGSTLRLYINGVQDGTNATIGSSSLTVLTENFSVGATGVFATGRWTGYIDDVRITKGVCRYPSGTTFTPPTAAFPNS